MAGWDRHETDTEVKVARVNVAAASVFVQAMWVGRPCWLLVLGAKPGNVAKMAKDGASGSPKCALYKINVVLKKAVCVS